MAVIVVWVDETLAGDSSEQESVGAVTRAAVTSRLTITWTVDLWRG